MKIARMSTFSILAGLMLLAAAPAEAGRSHRRHGHSIHLNWGPGWGWWSPGFYSGFYSGPYAGHYGGDWGGYPRVYPNASYGSYGALDIDLSPERAEVWVDGKKVGVADDFDGFPSHLWLEKGTYDVVFYLPGYETLARQYSVYPGLIIDVEDDLTRGESVHPAELGPKTHVRRDARLQAEREIREEVERRRGRVSEETPEDRREALDTPGERYEVRGDAESDEIDARSEPGRLVLRIRPDDASVYLDGKFLGTARDIARLRSGLIVDAGEHRVEVVRPGLEGVDREVRVESGREVEVELDLERD